MGVSRGFGFVRCSEQSPSAQLTTGRMAVDCCADDLSNSFRRAYKTTNYVVFSGI